MTICIGVLCEDYQKIVCVTDEKVDFGQFSADKVAAKIHVIARSWVAMYAGNDGEHADFILESAMTRLMKREPVHSPLEVSEVVDDAFHEFQQKLIESKVLRKRNFTADKFATSGKRLCTPEVYNNLCNRIDKVSISLKFLLCGFEGKRGHLVCMDADEGDIPSSRDTVGAWAIGSGARLALASLAFAIDKRNLSTYSKLPDAIYAACEAKFLAESNALVGHDTAVYVLNPDLSIDYIYQEKVQKIREYWALFGAPRVPERVIAEIPSLLEHLPTSNEWSDESKKPNLPRRSRRSVSRK